MKWLSCFVARRQLSTVSILLSIEVTTRRTLEDMGIHTDSKLMARISIKIEWEFVGEFYRCLNDSVIDRLCEACQADRIDATEAMNSGVELPCCIVVIRRRGELFVLQTP